MLKQFACAAWLVICVAVPAHAQTGDDDDWLRCADNNPEISIDGCTAFIRSGREAPANLATAFYNRGIARNAKGELDQALADYDQAIKLNPSAAAFNNRAGIYRASGQNDEAIADYDRAIALNPHYAKIFNNRGIVYRAMGQTDQALADFDQAIKLDSNFAVAFFSRGLTHFYLGQFGSAATDLARSVSLEPSDAYSVLWLHIARERSGVSDADAFSRAAAKLDLGEWPGPLVSLYLGKATADQVRVAAARGDAKTVLGQGCEAAFYSGENELLRRNPLAAKALLQDAANICPHTFEEYLGAVAELPRVK